MKFSGSAILLLTALLSVPGDAAASDGYYPEITIRNESAEGLLLEYVMPELESRPMGEKIALSLPWHDELLRPGFPSVPVRNFLIALPPGADLSAELEGVTVEESYSFDIAPVPQLDTDGNLVPLDWDERMEPGAQPEEWLRISKPTRLRDQRVVSLSLFPVRYDRSTGKTVLLRKGTVRLSFSGGENSTRLPKGEIGAGRFDRLYSRTLVNHESARAWRRPPAVTRKRGATADSYASSFTWMRLSIRDRGLHAVTYNDLVASGIVDPRSDIGDPRSIRIYWGGGQVLNSELNVPRSEWMRQISIRVEGER